MLTLLSLDATRTDAGPPRTHPVNTNSRATYAGEGHFQITIQLLQGASALLEQLIGVSQPVTTSRNHDPEAIAG